MTRHDLVVIGAGPSAIAAMLALPKDAPYCVITGEQQKEQRLKQVHPKIRSVAYENYESPAVAQIKFTNSTTHGMLYAACGVGGLARYWGQQFIRYAPNDPWCSNVFSDYEDYSLACAAVETPFALSPGISDEQPLPPYVASTARLLVGTASDKASGLLAMGRLCEEMLARPTSTIVRDRVDTISSMPNGLRVRLSGGEDIETRRIILAAGVVGTFNILARSHSEIEGAIVSDHAPFMLYAGRARRIRPRSRIDEIDHFNVRTIERLETDRVVFFGSMYRMSAAPLSLTLAGVGLPSVLRGRKTPVLADVVTPVQLWTEKTVAQYEISSRGHYVRSEPTRAWRDDPEVTGFVAWMREQGASVFRVSAASPGAGFHYHGTMLALRNAPERTGVRQFVADSYRGKVICVDASMLNQIGCRPSGVTVMATAYKLTQQAIASW